MVIFVGAINVNAYIQGIWKARYFWIHLSRSDLRSRWRRSFFGIFWCILQPLGMTALLAVVFSKLLNTDIVTYAPYILSGIILWECIMTCIVGGSLSFVQADAYIKQCKHPLAIYTLRTVLTNLTAMSVASISLLGWSFVVLGKNFGLPWLALLTVVPIMAIILWPLSTLFAYFGTKYRDIPHMMGLVMQALWFISPVYFEEKMFRQGGLDALVDYNPIYHLLQLVRAPLLNGKWPTWENYAFCIGAAVVFAILAWAVGRKIERKVIFYL